MASSTSGQNNPLTYMDGISVKIAENYKPPKRIPMVMSYSQRVALNRLIQEPILTYDFSMEESVKTKMYEWKKARTAVKEQRKQRLNQLTQAMNSKWETSEDVSNNEVLDSKDNIKKETTDNIQDNTADSRLSHDPYYQTESGILIPKIFPSQQQSKVLMPMQLANSQSQSTTESRNIQTYSHKNPINYSEFESDTSSPFDNMELKTINDFEELAQVLKYDSDDNVTSNSMGASQQQHFLTTCPKTNKVMTYVTDNMYSKLDNHLPIYGLEHNIPSKKNPINGYYYDNYSQNTLTTQMTARDAHIRSVPEIMKSLQAELASTRVSEPRVKEIPATESSSVNTTMATDNLEDPFKHLTPDLQRLAQSISSMGFPLPRVARACQLFEGNQKKIVEHLLAMSELLDLGFPEQTVASALIKCENDRDKALDLLIT